MGLPFFFIIRVLIGFAVELSPVLGMVFSFFFVHVIICWGVFELARLGSEFPNRFSFLYW